MARDPDNDSPHRTADFVAAAACAVALAVSTAGLLREPPVLREPASPDARPKPAFVKLDPTKLSAAAAPAAADTVAAAVPAPAPAPLPPVASLPDLRLPDLPAVPARRQVAATAVATAAVVAPAARAGAKVNGTAAAPAVLNVADVAGVQPWPEYPYECLRRRESGVVKVRFHVDPDGTVRHASAFDSSGCERLDDAAVSTILRQWRFPAGEVRHYEISIRFQLQ